MKLEEHPFIQSIPEQQRARLMADVEVLEHPIGAAIFDQGSHPDSMYLILDGTVSFGLERDDGSRHVVSHSNPGEFFGEVGVLTKELRALDAKADTKCQIARINEATFNKIIKEAAPMRKILESIIRHLSSTTDHYMSDLMQREKLSLVGTMMASILHDFRNPFSIISLGAHFISQRHKEDSKTLQICNNIEAQIRRMVDMANDLSAFSRGDDEIEIETIHVSEWLRHFRELNGLFFEDPLIPIELELDDVFLDIDVGKINRVMQNLLNNAREAIEGHNSTGEIVIRCYETEKATVLTVKDNGPGIPESIRENFFEPFVTTGKKDGTGLGSAIVKSIISAHKGEIRFETGPKGTTFIMEFPN